MKSIDKWFNGDKNYNDGVDLYASLPIKKSWILKKLIRGYNRRNFGTLVSELRKFKNNPTTKNHKKKNIPSQPITQEVINKEINQKKLINNSVNREFSKIMIGELPGSLRPRYSRAYNLFLQMIELKFALNSLPASAEGDALKIIIQIEQLDEERDLIWKEIRHWKKHKTLLSNQVDDFSNLSELELDQKKRNISSSITKISNRVDLLYNELYKETDKFKQKKIETKINKSETLIHKHRINRVKIKKLI